MPLQTELQSDSVSRFRIVELLGRGGMGVVYKAVDLRLERTVALKFLAADRGEREEDRRRFLREARAASALDHPNICTLYEIGEAEDGRLFLAMAYVEGETLARRIERGPLPLAQAVDIAGQVAAGLQAAHEKGIVHRDVKPGNLLVTPAGQVKIVDFGIARRTDQTLLTHAGMALGTTAYMAPEQLRGEPIDPRTDLWALGVVLYEMVTGEVPFGESEAEAPAAILQRTPRPLRAVRPEVPAELAEIVVRALAKPRGQRYPSAARLRADLAQVAQILARAGPAAAWPMEMEETLLEGGGPPQTPMPSMPAPRPAPGTDELPTGLPPGFLVAQFRVEAPLGSGSMGVVYRALDTRLGRHVALKFLAPELTRDPAAKERFLREARAASALDHPNLCTVHEVGETAEERLYLAMPCYDGETLAERIARGPLPTPDAVEIAAQAARGLAKAHRGGIVHRDVKPANLMVTGDSVVKILDFGLAQLASEAGSGSLAGTPAYMSPEQTRKEPVGPATDVWSLGVVLYEMLAGVRPFGGGGGGASAVFHAIRETAPAPLARRPGVPAELPELVSRMLGKDPAGRPAVSEVLADLDRLRIGLTTGLPLAPASAARPAGVRIGLALAVLLALLTGIWLWQRGGDSRPAAIQASFAPLTNQEGRESSPSLAPDGTRFVYAKTVAGRSHLYLQRLGEESVNPEDLSPDARWDDSQPAFSPDGRQLAFRSERDGGGIFLLPLAGGPARRLTDFGYNPAWSPDGREIAVATIGVNDPISWKDDSTIVRIDVATGRRSPLVLHGGVQPSWSPHGRRIAYWGVPTGTARRVIWTVPVAGGRPVPVLADDRLNWDPLWSPDGRYLYYASDRSGSMNLWRVPIDESSGEPAGASEPIVAPAAWSGQLSISRDGRHILYATDDGKANIERVAFDPAAEQVVGPLTPITQGSRRVESLAVSPDGRFVAFATSLPQEDLYLVRSNGTDLRQLTRDRDKDRVPQWSPAGDRLVFDSNRGGHWDAWFIRPDGRGLTPATQTRGDGVFNPLWSPDGRRLACLLGFSGGALVDLSRPLAERSMTRLPIPGFVPRAWSPDGRAIEGSVGFEDLSLYSLATGRCRTLLAEGGRRACWLPDSRRLLYLTPDGAFLLDSRTGRTHAMLSPPAGTQLSALDLTRDGRTLYLVQATNEGDIWELTLR